MDDLISSFFQWEQASRDTIDFKKCYVDMAGDLISGLVLSQIVYWHLPGRNGVTKLRVNHLGEQWIAKKRDSWWDEIRVTPKQLDRSIRILSEANLIETGLFKFDGVPVLHVRIKWEGFMAGFQESILPKGESPTFPKGQSPFSPNGKVLLTENTNIDYKDNAASSEADYTPIAQPKLRPIPNAFRQKVALPIKSLPEESDGPTPPTELESLLNQTMKRINGEKFKRLSRANQKKLTQDVIVNGETYGSPEVLWSSNPRFKDFIREQCEWYAGEANVGDKNQDRLVNMVRRYDNKPYGWLSYDTVYGIAEPIQDAPKFQPLDEDFMLRLYGEDRSNWPL